MEVRRENLYDYSARYYESAVGRFTSVDPLAEKCYNISPYTYVANNPLKYVNPTGKELEDPIVWFLPSEKNAKSMPPKHIEYKRGDNRFYVFGHGTPTSIYNKGTRLGNPKSINEALSKESPAWKKAMEKGEPVTLYLYTCNSATEGDFVSGSGENVHIRKGTNNPIAKQISKEYPNVIVVGFDGQYVYEVESGETTGVLNENEDGGIVIYKNGKEIAKIPYPENFTKVEKEKIEEEKKKKKEKSK